jgi:hypothetical protein
MEKEDLERELEKAEKGCVITIINQSSHPLVYDGSKASHGKFKAKPPKIIIARVWQLANVLAFYRIHC